MWGSGVNGRLGRECHDDTHCEASPVEVRGVLSDVRRQGVRVKAGGNSQTSASYSTFACKLTNSLTLENFWQCRAAMITLRVSVRMEEYLFGGAAPGAS